MGANNYAKKAKKAFLYLVRALSVKSNAGSKVMINISKISVNYSLHILATITGDLD